MGMSVGSDSTHEDEGIVDINTTPLIDVMLVLLIMLIITIPLQTHSVAIDLPRAILRHPPSSPSWLQSALATTTAFPGTVSRLRPKQHCRPILKPQLQKVTSLKSIFTLTVLQTTKQLPTSWLMHSVLA